MRKCRCFIPNINSKSNFYCFHPLLFSFSRFPSITLTQQKSARNASELVFLLDIEDITSLIYSISLAMFMAALAYDSLQVVYLLSLFNPLSLCFLMFPGITLTSYKYVPDASENVFAETLKASIALIYWTDLVHITLVKNLMTFFLWQHLPMIHCK